MLYFIKIGTNCLFNEKNKVDHALLEQKVREIESLQGDKVLIVSGAIKLGKRSEHEERKNSELTNPELQGYASVGQRILMNLYDKHFKSNTAQILLTKEDMKHSNHIKDLINENRKKHRISLLNYNDTIDWKGVRTDNDSFGAEVMIYCDGDKLISLGRGYNGFCKSNGEVIRKIRNIDDQLYKLCNGASSDGTGGMKVKLDAGKLILKHNKEMVIANIHQDIRDIIKGTAEGTYIKK